MRMRTNIDHSSNTSSPGREQLPSKMLTLARRSVFVTGRNAVSAACATRRKHTLPDLPYECSALEPIISGEIMDLHHSKHHATYVNNLNAAKEQLQSAIQSGTWKCVGLGRNSN